MTEQKKKEWIVIKLGDKYVKIEIKALSELQIGFTTEIDNDSKYQSET